MGAGPEAALILRIRKAIKARWPASFFVKVHGGKYQDAGLPDLFVVVQGRLVGIEVKAQRPGESEEHARGRLTLRQQSQLEAMRRAGCVAGLAISVPEALALVEQVELV